MRIDRLTTLVNEYKQLYGVNEAEGVLLVQLAQLVIMLNWSPKLTAKLLKVLAAVMEVLIDEMEKEKTGKK